VFSASKYSLDKDQLLKGCFEGGLWLCEKL